LQVGEALFAKKNKRTWFVYKEIMNLKEEKELNE